MPCSGWRAGLFLDPVSLKAKKKKKDQIRIPAAVRPTLLRDCINSSHSAMAASKPRSCIFSYKSHMQLNGVHVVRWWWWWVCSGEGEIQLKENKSLRQRSAGSTL